MHAWVLMQKHNKKGNFEWTYKIWLVEEWFFLEEDEFVGEIGEALVEQHKTNEG